MIEPTPSQVRAFIDRHLKNVSQHGKEAKFLCPVHDDHHPSAEINPQSGLWRCYACKAKGNIFTLAQHVLNLSSWQEAYREVLGPNPTPPREKKPGRPSGAVQICSYQYVDEHGAFLYEKRRYEPKWFDLWSKTENGAWLNKLNGQRRVLYRLPEILQAQTVLVVEGEKDADTAAALGYAATCNAFGAGEWKEEYSRWLHGKHVVILPDQDQEGQKHANLVAQSVKRLAQSVKIINVPKGKDFTEWIESGGNKLQLDYLIEAAAPLFLVDDNLYPNEEEESIPRQKKPSDCPDIPEAAWHRLAKMYRSAVGICTEASDNFHFAAFLVAAGAVLGRLVSTNMPDPIYPNFYIALYGRSSKARKTTAINFAQRTCLRLPQEITWVHSIDSWEGFVDLLQARQQLQEDRKAITCVVKLSELRALIDKVNREGSRNIVPNLADAFDTPDRFERNLARRSNPNTGGGSGTVEKPFLSVIGGVATSWLDKIRREDLEGGLGNRFLWIPGDRKERIPNPPSPNLNEILKELAIVREWWKEQARNQESATVTFRKSPEAETKWNKFYNSLDKITHDDPLIEMLTDRLEVQTIKIALLYAALDIPSTPIIEVCHIDAAIAFAKFLIRATEYIFSDFGIDEAAKDEQKIVDAVRDAGEKGITHRALQKRFWRMGAEQFIRRIRWITGDDGYLRSEREGRTVRYFANENRENRQ
jgi:5S rRNA maturation endonuclease (ribonuclease M5)